MPGISIPNRHNRIAQRVQRLGWTVDGHTAELGFRSGTVAQDAWTASWPIFPTFLKLGPCQGLMHWIELGLDSSCGRWGCRSWPGAPPCCLSLQEKGVAAGPAVYASCASLAGEAPAGLS